MVLSSRKDVEALLEEMRAAIKFGKVNFINRSKNMNTLAKLGWMPEDAIDEIETLTYDEYKNLSLIHISIAQLFKNIKGVTGITNDVAAVGGSDAETDEALRERILLRLQTPATSGNAYH